MFQFKDKKKKKKRKNVKEKECLLLFVEQKINDYNLNFSNEHQSIFLLVVDVIIKYADLDNFKRSVKIKEQKKKKKRKPKIISSLLVVPLQTKPEERFNKTARLVRPESVNQSVSQSVSQSVNKGCIRSFHQFVI